MAQYMPESAGALATRFRPLGVTAWTKSPSEIAQVARPTQAILPTLRV